MHRATTALTAHNSSSLRQCADLQACAPQDATSTTSHTGAPTPDENPQEMHGSIHKDTAWHKSQWEKQRTSHTLVKAMRKLFVDGTSNAVAPHCSALFLHGASTSDCMLGEEHYGDRARGRAHLTPTPPVVQDVHELESVSTRSSVNARGTHVRPTAITRLWHVHGAQYA